LSPLAWHFSAPRCSTPSPANACEDRFMIIDYVLGAIVTVGLLVYLVTALIRPERF
jgi:K+-transporting ATPase KdpF subunit